MKSILLLALVLLTHTLTAQIFFSEDFETVTSPALPANWTVITQASDGGYTTGDATDANNNGMGTWSVPNHTQFAMTNDDVCNCTKLHDYLVLPVQDFSSITGGIDLEAAVHHNGSFGGQSHLMVSIDTGNTWTAVDTFAPSSIWQNITVSLNAYIGIPHVMVAFHFSDGGLWATGLAIDDVVLRQVTGFNDLVALGHAQEYTMIPESQVSNMPLTATVKNQGTSTAFDATLTTQIFQSPNLSTPIQTLTGNPDTLIPTQSKILSSGTYLPNGLGTYLFKHIVSTTSFTDGNTTNDTTEYWLTVTDSIYARDDNNISYSIGNSGFGNTIEVGQMFDIHLTSTMSSVTFGTEGANTGDTATITIYNTLAGAPSTPITSYDYAFQAKGFQYITIPTHVILPPGTYFLAIKENTMTDTLGILGTNDIFTAGKAFLSLNGGSFVDMAAQGYPAALSLRPNITVACPTIATNTTQIACAGDTNGLVTVTIAGGLPPFSYNWSTGSTDTSIVNLSAGTYYVTLTDGNNCVTIDSSIIVNPIPLVGGDTTLLVTCADSCNGSAFALPTGGTFPYYFQWDTTANSSITYDVHDLCAGNYQCTVTDFRGCTVIINTTVEVYSPIDSILKTDATSTGGTDGTATIYYSDSSWTYLWNTGDTTTGITGLNAGWYTITATDSLGCMVVDSIEILDPPVGVSNLSNISTVKLYPNPTRGALTLEIQQATNNIQIELYNATGQRLQTWTKLPSNNQLQLDLKSYASGVYWLHLQIDDQQQTQKIIRLE